MPKKLRTARSGSPKLGKGIVGSEEDVKIKFLVPFLESKGYHQDCIDFDKAIEVQEGRKHKTIFADAVVYTAPAKSAPLIVCETKPPNEVLNRAIREQVISYARLLPRIAPLALVTNGIQTQIYQTLNKRRIPELPHRKDLDEDFVKFVLSAEIQEALRTEAKHELFVIDDVQSFKTVLKACHDAIRNNEGYDPAIAFDEMSKVLFCKLYEEKQNPGDGNRFRLAIFDDTLGRLGINVVKRIFEETKQDPRFAGLFGSDSIINLHDRTVRSILGQFENYDLSLTAFDVKGEAFEYFLGETFTGGLGEYFTPRNVVEFMVDAVDPKIGSRIIDPFCGTGGFLIYAFEVVSQKIRLQEFSEEEKEKWRFDLSSRCLYGTDWKERTSLACKMNMTVHGDGSAGIFMHHGLVDVEGFISEDRFDICLTNPPFGSIENDPSILQQYELGAGRRSQDRLILGIERAVRLVRPAGIICIVVIDGVLNNDSKDYVRNYIRRNAWLRGVISLPAVTFEGYHSRAKTSILFLERKQTPDEGKQGKIFMSIVENSGYAPNGAQVAGNELPEVLLDFRAFLRGVHSQVHRNSWVATLGSRMDAEHYWNRPAPPTDGRRAEEWAEDAVNSLKDVSVELATVRSAIEAAFSKLKSLPTTLSELFEPIRQIEQLEPDKTYRLLGVKWWGGGTFVREEKLGKEIKARKMNKVEAGWLIYNRLFAFRGSFAVVPPEHANCHVSGEFPTFRVREDVTDSRLVTAYVNYCLNSPQYLSVVDRDSTGSTKTSRNRYKEDRFLAMRVSMPITIEQMQQLVALLDQAFALRLRQETLTNQIERLSDGIARMLPFSEKIESDTPEERMIIEVLAKQDPISPSQRIANGGVERSPHKRGRGRRRNS